MRARYRSAGLTPHQHGWKDAGWTVPRLQLFLHNSSRKGTLYCTPLVFLLALSATHGANMGSMELGSCYLWGNLIRCLDGERDHDVGKQGGRLRGGGLGPLAANRGDKCRASYVCISFLRAVVVVLVVSVIILIHFVVVIFSLCMMLNRCFWCFSQVYSTRLHAYVEEGWAGFSQLVYGWRGFQVWGIRLGMGSISLFFTGSWCVCVVCVCVRTRTHTACGVLGCEPGCRDETPGETGRNLDVL